MNHSPHLASNDHSLLKRDIAASYKRLISSRYFTTSHLEQIVIEASSSLKRQDEKRSLYILIYLKGVFNHICQGGTYEKYERRFQHFFQCFRH